MKICQLNDYDWWIGESFEACVRDYQSNIAEDGVEDDAHELCAEELDHLIFSDCDEDERPTGVKRTFREQLAIEVAAGGEFPRMFASTEG
jgi:hypothetical protein